MHELSITQSILNIALDTAEKEKARRVNKINITLGEMTGFVPRYIQEYFNIVSRDTIASGAKLEFKKTYAAAKCLDCGEETRLTDYRFVCGRCGGQRLKLISGKEFLVESIDID